VILEITRYELAAALRTKRALVVAALYFLFACAGEGTYVLILRAIEAKVQELASQAGDAAAGQRQLLELLGDENVRKMLAWFGGVPANEMAPYLLDSLLLPMLLWASLAFLPFMIVLTSFDQLAADLDSRSLCYSTLRVRRRDVVLGKVLAHAVIFTALLALTGIVLLGLGAAFLDSVDVLATLPGLVAVLALLVPYGLCYLGISAFASASTKQPFAALVLAFGITIGLRMLDVARIASEEGNLALVRHLRWLSPAAYHDQFWFAGLEGPALGVAAYLGFAVVFLALAIQRLEKRDL
jgi:ABC-type transport system involved in multi-copper enzyme maturation permease subunit